MELSIIVAPGPSHITDTGCIATFPTYGSNLHIGERSDAANEHGGIIADVHICTIVADDRSRVRIEREGRVGLRINPIVNVEDSSVCTGVRIRGGVLCGWQRASPAFALAVAVLFVAIPTIISMFSRAA